VLESIALSDISNTRLRMKCLKANYKSRAIH